MTASLQEMAAEINATYLLETHRDKITEMSRAMFARIAEKISEDDNIALGALIKALNDRVIGLERIVVEGDESELVIGLRKEIEELRAQVKRAEAAARS